MPAYLRVSTLIPAGLIVDGVIQNGGTITVTAHAGAKMATCPLCRSPSPRIHSRYARQVSDLPCSGQSVVLRVVTRRFRCMTPHCRRRIFAERFEESVLPERSRRTSRLDCIVHHLGLALGGRPAASFARRLMLPVSNDTVLRVVRRRARPWTEPLNVVGIDDWAFRRNHAHVVHGLDTPCRARRRIRTRNRTCEKITPNPKARGPPAYPERSRCRTDRTCPGLIQPKNRRRNLEHCRAGDGDFHA